MTGLFLCSQAFGPLLERGASHQDPARIINIASIDGISVPTFEEYVRSSHVCAHSSPSRRSLDHWIIPSTLPMLRMPQEACKKRSQCSTPRQCVLQHKHTRADTAQPSPVHWAVVRVGYWLWETWGRLVQPIPHADWYNQSPTTNAPLTGNWLCSHRSLHTVLTVQCTSVNVDGMRNFDRC